MRTIQRGCLVVAALLLAACGSASDEDARPQPPPVKDTVFGDMVGTMDKARAVEGSVLQQKETMDRSIEQSEAAQPDDQ